jgi:mannitol/fructose-specific phosphotransferase system IIA component (Ntr-type)
VVLTDLLDAARVRVPLGSRTKDDVLRELVVLAAGELGPTVVDAVLGSVRDREQRLSTGIGDGVAIPHGTTPHLDHLIIAAGVAREPIDFDSLDGKPVDLFFLLIGPEGASGAHVKALGWIARLLRHAELRGALRSAPDNHAFVKAVRSLEPA